MVDLIAEVASHHGGDRRNQLLHWLEERPRTPRELVDLTGLRYKLLYPVLDQLRQEGYLCRRRVKEGPLWMVKAPPRATIGRLDAYAVVLPSKSRHSESWWLSGASSGAERSIFVDQARQRDRARAL